jgi:predicted nucleic acid-binding protein
LRQIFADTAHWLALTNPFDQHHDKATRVSASLQGKRIVTSDAVLTEYLNALADRGSTVRVAAVRSVESILRNSGVMVIAQTRRLFLKGFALYKARADKGYSLTDCVSMAIMRQQKITNALTTDHHFEQEGFAALMRQ